MSREDLQSLWSQPWLKFHLMGEDANRTVLPAEMGRLSIEKVVRDLGAGTFSLGRAAGDDQEAQGNLLVQGLEPTRLHIDKWQ